MKLSIFDKRQPVFGLDIGIHETKFVQINKAGHRIRLVGLGSTRFDDSTVIEGVIAEPEKLADTLSENLSKPFMGHITAKAAAIGLPQSHMFTRLLKLPAMDSKKLAEAVQWEGQQYIPMPMNDLYIDFEIVETANDSNGKPREHEILLVAAPRAIVDSYMKLLEFMRVSPHSMEMSLAANIRALRKPKDNTPVLIIDAGSQSTDLAIVSNVIRLTTTINFGGDQITSIIKSKLKITLDQAEEIKIKFGIGKSDLQPKAQAALAPSLITLATEIIKLIRFYEDRSTTKDQQKVTRILLTGGASRMPGLAHYISQATKLNVDISSPWDSQPILSHKLFARSMGPVYTTAFGLALRELSR